MNPESRSVEYAQGESRLVWQMSYARWYKAQSLYTKQRFVKGVQRNMIDFLKAWITTDNIKIFSYYILYSSYCFQHVQKSERRFQNCALIYVTTFNMQYCTLACFVLKQECVCCRDVLCCMLLNDSVFVLWINNFKCSLKTTVSLVLATKQLKL